VQAGQWDARVPILRHFPPTEPSGISRISDGAATIPPLVRCFALRGDPMRGLLKSSGVCANGAMRPGRGLSETNEVSNVSNILLMCGA
jgi:hypothetical protein